MTTVTDARRMADDPVAYFGDSGRAAHHLERGELTRLQLAGLRLRFEDLRDRVAVLRSLADEQGVREIETLDDAAPLLFPHTIYKSYPVSLLENGRFDRLTKWLGRLTTHDLSSIRVDGCDSIDSWLDVLDAETQVRVAHSSGTSGTMTFLPRARAEYEAFFKILRMSVFEFIDPQERLDHFDEHFDVIWPSFARGRSGTARAAEFYRDHLAGSPERFHPLNTGFFSADVMFFAARMKLAAARGEMDKVRISAQLKARQAEFVELQKALAEATGRMLDDVVLKLEGRRVFLIGQMVALAEMSRAATERGVRGVFATGSVVQTGGGAKGVVLPPTWEADVAAFAGVPRLAFTYGMTEINMVAYLCEHERYHLPPWIVPFLLDPETGAPLPRTGTQTGRAAFFDLVPQTYWGGFVSGDEVTLDWAGCACGRTSPCLHRAIQRYSDKHGGDDKINCAATEEAHKAALDTLTAQLD
jgi:hypothetical protein